MRTFGAAIALALLLGVTSQVHAASRWSLGANMDLTIHDPNGPGDNTTIFGWPSSVSFFQPGFRLGFQPEGGTHEVFANAGFLTASQSGNSFRDLVTSLNYQYNFKSSSKTRPYVTAGMGLFNEHVSSGSSSDGATSGIGGGGLGLRHWFAGDNGSLRFEARYDRIGWSKHGEIERAGMFGLRLGFDVWLK